MPLESGERRGAAAARPQTNMVGPHPPPKLSKPLPCLRCESTNTKFCYYNNYKLSQPRHFCKSCRRYWTHGGTLRSVPVGGGTRKTSKRSRSSSSSTTTTSTSTSSSSTTSASTLTHESLPVPYINLNPTLLSVLKSEKTSEYMDLNDNLSVPVNQDGNFISLMNRQQRPPGLGSIMGMVGYGSVYGYGLCEEGLGFGGRGSWPYPGMGYASSGGVNGGALEEGGTSSSSGHNTWVHMGDGEGGGGGGGVGDCFSWPGLAISKSGNGFK